MGGDETGVPWKDWAWQCWNDRYGTKAPWLAKDFVILAKALSAFEDEATARAAWTAFLASEDPFYAGHEPGKFLASLGRWIPKQPRQRRDPMNESDDYKRRAAALVRIHREVAVDEAIPSDGKRTEVSRRFREEFPG
jgi:hypothetical protein